MVLNRSYRTLLFFYHSIPSCPVELPILTKKKLQNAFYIFSLSLFLFLSNCFWGKVKWLVHFASWIHEWSWFLFRSLMTAIATFGSHPSLDEGWRYLTFHCFFMYVSNISYWQFMIKNNPKQIYFPILLQLPRVCGVMISVMNYISHIPLENGISMIIHFY